MAVPIITAVVKGTWVSVGTGSYSIQACGNVKSTAPTGVVESNPIYVIVSASTPGSTDAGVLLFPGDPPKYFQPVTGETVYVSTPSSGGAAFIAEIVQVQS